MTYENGQLSKAVTRGNGEIGEVITNNARTFINIPTAIPYTEKLVIRGEALITYSDFDKINAQLEEEEAYKNPRNLCSGSVRQLNNEITAKRKVRVICYNILEGIIMNDLLKKKEELPSSFVFVEKCELFSHFKMFWVELLLFHTSLLTSSSTQSHNSSNT